MGQTMVTRCYKWKFQSLNWPPWNAMESIGSRQNEAETYSFEGLRWYARRRWGEYTSNRPALRVSKEAETQRGASFEPGAKSSGVGAALWLRGKGESCRWRSRYLRYLQVSPSHGSIWWIGPKPWTCSIWKFCFLKRESLCWTKGRNFAQDMLFLFVRGTRGA